MSQSKRLQLNKIRAHCPELDRLTDLVVAFPKMLCHRHGDQLPVWLEAAEHAPA